MKIWFCDRTGFERRLWLFEQTDMFWSIASVESMWTGKGVADIRRYEKQIIFYFLQQSMRTIKKQFEILKETPSDINEHLQTLHDLASECDHVTEFWVRTAVSTIALIAWLKHDAKMISYDLNRSKEIETIFKQCMIEEKNRSFRIADTRELEIEETDFLFIDTRHVADCLEKELELSAPKVRKYIAFHDTTTFWTKGEAEGHEGLKVAMDAYLKDHKEREVFKVFTNNNGLTIRKRK